MIQGIITGILLIAFLAGTAWVFSSRRSDAFDAAARIPLDDLPPTSDNDTH